MRISGWVLLGLEQGIEIPEAAHQHVPQSTQQKRPCAPGRLPSHQTSLRVSSQSNQSSLVKGQNPPPPPRGEKGKTIPTLKRAFKGREVEEYKQRGAPPALHVVVGGHLYEAQLGEDLAELGANLRSGP